MTQLRAIKKTQTKSLGTLFFRIKKLTECPDIIHIAAKHNKRESMDRDSASWKIKGETSINNYCLRGPNTAAEIGRLAKERMHAAGIRKLRKNAVRGIEVIFSLPTNFDAEHRKFFENCLQWSEQNFGGSENILSADVHLDESAPHMHILILPLVDGRMMGSDMVGYKSKLAALTESFFKDVGMLHGLKKPTPRLEGTCKTRAARAVFRCLRMHDDPALKSRLKSFIRDAIEDDPRRALSALDIPFEPKKRRTRTMAQIFTSKGKGATRETSILAS